MFDERNVLMLALRQAAFGVDGMQTDSGAAACMIGLKACSRMGRPREGEHCRWRQRLTAGRCMRTTGK
jgi:hypothetical protein